VKDDAPPENQNESIEKATRGLRLLREAILELLHDHPEGLRNTDIAKKLTLESDHQGNQRDYLTYSILGLLMKEKKVEKVKRGFKTFYLRKA
jgi:hypothetical protein